MKKKLEEEEEEAMAAMAVDYSEVQVRLFCAG